MFCSGLVRSELRSHLLCHTGAAAIVPSAPSSSRSVPPYSQGGGGVRFCPCPTPAPRLVSFRPRSCRTPAHPLATPAAPRRHSPYPGHPHPCCSPSAPGVRAAAPMRRPLPCASGLLRTAPSPLPPPRAGGSRPLPAVGCGGAWSNRSSIGQRGAVPARPPVAVCGRCARAKAPSAAPPTATRPPAPLWPRLRLPPMPCAGLPPTPCVCSWQVVWGPGCRASWCCVCSRVALRRRLAPAPASCSIYIQAPTQGYDPPRRSGRPCDVRHVR